MTTDIHRFDAVSPWVRARDGGWVCRECGVSYMHGIHADTCTHTTTMNARHEAVETAFAEIEARLLAYDTDRLWQTITKRAGA